MLSAQHLLNALSLPFKWEPCLWTNTLDVVKKVQPLLSQMLRSMHHHKGALLQFNAVCGCVLSI